MSGMHFERMAAEYAGARPPYPDGLYRALLAAGVTGPGRRVLEIGAGAGLATAELVRSGSDVVALEPGQALRAEMRAVAPDVEVIAARLEDADLPIADFDSVAAAMSLHWVDLAVGLPKFHRALRPRGWLAVWRTKFGDANVETEFRRRIERIIAARDPSRQAQRLPPTMDELAAGGWFEPVSTEQWRWTIDLTTDQVRRLFRTFSNWEPSEAEAAAEVADDLGGVVAEHYRTILHLLRRRDG
jgi:SAM-dependent methyltransferase